MQFGVESCPPVLKLVGPSVSLFLVVAEMSMDTALSHFQFFFPGVVLPLVNPLSPGLQP